MDAVTPSHAWDLLRDWIRSYSSLGRQDRYRRFLEADGYEIEGLPAAEARTYIREAAKNMRATVDAVTYNVVCRVLDRGGGDEVVEWVRTFLGMQRLDVPWEETGARFYVHFVGCDGTFGIAVRELSDLDLRDIADIFWYDAVQVNSRSGRIGRRRARLIADHVAYDLNFDDEGFEVAAEYDSHSVTIEVRRPEPEHLLTDFRLFHRLRAVGRLRLPLPSGSDLKKMAQYLMRKGGGSGSLGSP